MCLCKKSRIPRIAIKDIVVYKILLPTKNILGGGYKTPYQDCIVNINNLHYGKFNYQDTLLTSFIRPTIESGYIHSYISLESLNWALFSDMCIIKCVIPKGTLYWIGDNEDIASRKLKYLDIIVEGNREEIQDFIDNYGNK